ncbi:MAG TPA: aminotransferase class I/II-fold pyridoxal phosphate-dependent enzyme, partial [Candidatus Hydrogenedentes bacterium]|nr:aminotransferase class I/II-fold pyridoxal phosphate-dependent enzyme [Candidatus Hydrogenedentota bacterium]
MKYQRKLLAGITGYVPGEQPEIPGVIKLNTNENPYPPSPRVLEALRNLDTEHIRRYPDPACSRLRRAWAERFNLPGPEWVIVGNGMDDLLSLAVRAFVDPGDAVAATYPTYSLYEVLCGLHGARM